MKYNDNGTYKDIYVKSFDTLPVGAIVEYSGATIPSGWTDIGNNQIQKTSQYIEGGASLSNVYGTSDSNGYTQEYINNLADLLTTNKATNPTSSNKDCLLVNDDTVKGINLDFNPSNAPSQNTMVMWKVFLTNNTASDAYWTYIVLAITLDDHKMFMNAYHNATNNWIGWQQF